MVLRATVLITCLAASPATAQDSEMGAVIFQDFCATCHGPDASGNGPMAELLSIPTPDLTRLAARNDGVFPTGSVVLQIDGRTSVLAHGGDMPLFGRFFQGGADVAMKAPTGQPILTSQPIADLVAWLESIQQ